MGGADCELIRDGWLAQPVNAWSSAAFLVAAAWVAVRRGGDVVAVAALALVAVGSVAYHGPQPGWAEAVHDVSIVLLLGVVLLRIAEPGWRRPAAVVTGAAAVAVLLAPGLEPVAQAALAAGLVVAGLRRRRREGRAGPSARVAVVALAVGGLLFVLGRTDGPLCAPEDLVQPHAGWHVAAAVAAGAALGEGRRVSSRLRSAP